MGCITVQCVAGVFWCCVQWSMTADNANVTVKTHQTVILAGWQSGVARYSSLMLFLPKNMPSIGWLAVLCCPVLNIDAISAQKHAQHWLVGSPVLPGLEGEAGWFTVPQTVEKIHHD